jgi:hypothetical protein
VARVFPTSASAVNADAIINCVLGPDRRPIQCQPAINGAGVFRDLGVAAVQLASLWHNPIGEWASLQPGAPVTLIFRMWPASAAITRPTFEPPKHLPSGMEVPRTWSRWASLPTLTQIAEAVPVDPAPERAHGAAVCVVGPNGRLSNCELDPYTGFCRVQGVRLDCSPNMPNQISPDPSLLKLTELVVAPASTPGGQSSLGRRIYFSVNLPPLMDRLPPPPAPAPRIRPDAPE